jgi:hypothetical protein
MSDSNDLVLRVARHGLHCHYQPSGMTAICQSAPHRFPHKRQPILPEEHLVADKAGWRTEYAA